MITAADFPVHQARTLQHANVLGNRGKRDFEWSGEFNDAAFTLAKAADNGAAGGIGQRMKRSVKCGALSCHPVSKT
nr:hypothetical protein [Arthrobacter castelli]